MISACVVPRPVRLKHSPLGSQLPKFTTNPISKGLKNGPWMRRNVLAIGFHKTATAPSVSAFALITRIIQYGGTGLAGCWLARAYAVLCFTWIPEWATANVYAQRIGGKWLRKISDKSPIPTLWRWDEFRRSWVRFFAHVMMLLHHKHFIYRACQGSHLKYQELIRPIQ